jgi:hypothetical protein
MGGIPIQRPTEAEAIKVVHRALDLDVAALEMVRSDLFETVQFPFNFMVSETAEKLIPPGRCSGCGTSPRCPSCSVG